MKGAANGRDSAFPLRGFRAVSVMVRLQYETSIVNVGIAGRACHVADLGNLRQGHEPLQLALFSQLEIIYYNILEHTNVEVWTFEGALEKPLVPATTAGHFDEVTTHVRLCKGPYCLFAYRKTGKGNPTMQAQTPKDWPESTKYLRAPSYSKKLTKDKLDTLLLSKAGLTPKDPVLTTRGPHANVRIMPISSPSHPAYEQYGLYATQHLAPDSFILPYLGYVHDQYDLDETSNYDLSLDRELGVGVDASNMGNEARFINDYRGISAGPNAEFRDILVDIGFGLLERRIGIFVLSAGKSGKRAKGIAHGDEILVSYGKGFWAGRQTTTG